MHEIDDVMYFAIDEKGHSIDLTEKGREFLAPGTEDKDFFILPDMGLKLSIWTMIEFKRCRKDSKKDELGRTLR